MKDEIVLKQIFGAGQLRTNSKGTWLPIHDLSQNLIAVLWQKS